MPIEDEIRKITIKNAFEHKGKAETGAIMSKVLGQFPEYRSKAKEIFPIVSKVVAEINAMGPDEISRTVEKKYPDFLHKEKKIQEHRLPDLRNVTGKVVMRMAPSPSGPLHVGHSRLAILNDEYVKRYGGELILRIEDTNPANIDPNAYEQIPKDLEWLGVNSTQIVIQSDRMDLYYNEARNLIKLGFAYLCTCETEDFKKKLSKSIACPHRSVSPEENLKQFEKVLNGEYAPGEAVLIVKTQLDHPNPSVRDWIAFRISEANHPRYGHKYRFYPMMNFSVAVDDHLLGLTHVIRGKDHINNTERQKYIFLYNNWELPEYYHYGLVDFPQVVLKTSIIKKGIADGTYTGWDDIRLGSLMTFRKRGFSPETFRRYWIESGMREIDSEFSIEIFYAMNKELIDPETRRLFFVPDPVKIKLNGSPELNPVIQNHPSNRELGSRTYNLGLEPEVFVPKADWDSISEGEEFRLKDLCNVKKTQDRTEFISMEPSGKRVKIIQWCPKNSHEFRIMKPDGVVDHGVMEPQGKEFRGVAQLERYAYANILSSNEAYFTHK